MTDTRATTAPAVPRDDLSGLIKAYDVRGVVGEQIDAGLVREIGAALARLLRAESPETGVVVVGYDMRPSSPELAAAFADGVAAYGLDVVDIGLASTDHALLRLRCPRRARRHVHRQPQPREVQRDQALPGGRGPDRRRHRAGHDP